MAAIFPGDSFYEEATRLQLANLKRSLEFDCSIAENEESQSVLMRSVVGRSGERVFRGTGDWDGHPMRKVVDLGCMFVRQMGE